MPTPKGRPDASDTKDNLRESESNSKIKRTSLQIVKKNQYYNALHTTGHLKSDKNPDPRYGHSSTTNRSTSRGKQLSAKNRLVYKKDSMKNLNSNNVKSEMSMNNMNQPKMEDKENDFSQANNHQKLNRTSSGRDGKTNIKSMSGIRKLYTLKATNSNRRLESQSYRDLNYKQNTTNSSLKNGKVTQGSSTIYSTSISSKKKRTKNKISSSETPKLRSHNEAMFTGIKPKVKKEEMSDKENRYTANYDTRMLKKPPNPNTTNKKVKPSNFVKKPSSAHHVESRKVDISMDQKSDYQSKYDQNEIIKRNKVQDQIINHLKTGTLPKEPIITPIMSNDGQIRQYILNDPITNPDEIDSEISLLPADQITNTTVDKSKCSTRRNGIVKAYAANTNKGIIRNYNEDRVSIILNILKPQSRKGEDWPKCSFFGVFDGHGGAG